MGFLLLTDGGAPAPQFVPIVDLPGGMQHSISINSMPTLQRSKSSKKTLRRSKTAEKLPPVQRSLPPASFAPASPSSRMPPRSVSIEAAPATANAPPRPRPQLVRQYTGIGMAPTYSRNSASSSSSLFATAPVMTLDASPGLDGGLNIPSQDRALRKARAAKQRAERAERPKKNRGAHANPPLRTEGTIPVPPRTANAADAFDHQHIRRWDQAEGVLLALGRDNTHAAKQNAYEIAIMELFMNRYSEPTSLRGITGQAARRRKQKPKKPWTLEDSIWGSWPARVCAHKHTTRLHCSRILT